MIMSIR
ncbi:hypothetical protein D018_4959A, partial [Vibrio parahaemolyticus VP2007-007]